MSYKIIRFYADKKIEAEVIETGLSLEEVQERCSDPEASSRRCESAEGILRMAQCGPWFEGWVEE